MPTKVGAAGEGSVKVARRKRSLLELATELGNVSRACRVMGDSRQQFYEIRRNFQTFGPEGLLDRLPGARGPHPNRVSAEIETVSSTMRSPISVQVVLEFPPGCGSLTWIIHGGRVRGGSEVG
jgi:hypothetical protein